MEDEYNFLKGAKTYLFLYDREGLYTIYHKGKALVEKGTTKDINNLHL